ncbi:MAG: nucleotidyltransferase domain-containing protein [Coriobacteriia bacterium]|nr:nucleotidyltransferase domain-containing protein [Coriobacteriia bacterium]
MVRELEEKRQAVIDACRRFGVARMFVFGSALRDDFRPGDSDIDLLVEFETMTPHELVEAYFGLLDELRSVLEVPVDLVMSDAVKNRFITADIERTKQVLYAA